jgi:hypothetical protein
MRKQKAPNELLDEQLAEKTQPMNRKARRAIKYRREQIRAIMAQGHQTSWAHLSSAAGVWDQERTNK